MNLFPIVLTGQNLFDQAWTQGDLYSIQPIVNALGTFAGWVISIVGFGIVVFSILKNALSGLYVINPAIWDKVDELKNQVEQGVRNGTQGGNQAVAKLGGLAAFVLSYLPNLRALTDFADEQDVNSINKKQYFAKSIPLLVAQIFIGMLIFQGYPAQIASWIGDGATYTVGAIMDNIDPVEFVTGVSDSLVAYKLATDGSQDPLEQNINKMTSKMMTIVKTKYSDMGPDPAQETAYEIENMLLAAFQGDVVFENVLGAAEGYRVDINTTSQNSMPVISKSYSQIGSSGVYVAQATNGTYSFKYWVSGSSLHTGSTKVGSSDYFVWTVTATPEAISNVSRSELIVFTTVGNSTVTKEGTTMTINKLTVGNSTNDLKGTLGKSITVDVVDTNGDIIATLNAVLTGAGSVTQTSNVAPRLQFSSSEASKFTGFNNTGKFNGKDIAYLRLNLVGSWAKPFTTGATTTSVSISEIRIVPSVKYKSANGNSDKETFAIAAWEDISGSTVVGTSITDANITKALNSKSMTDYKGN